MCLMHQTTGGPQARAPPLSAWTGRATEKDWPKRPSDLQLQEAGKKTDRALTPAAEAVHAPAPLVPPGPRKPSSGTPFTLNSHWGRAATGKKRLASMRAGSLRLCPTLCNPVDCGLPGSLSGGFSREEYWRVLANTGWHALLEHCISCCLSCRPPEYLVLPEPLRPKQLHHLRTWPPQGQTQALRAASGAEPQRPTDM